MKPRRKLAGNDVPRATVAPEAAPDPAASAGKRAASTPLPIDVHDLRGVSQLAVAAVTGVTNLVEEMHRNIASFAPVLGRVEPARIGGISGWVYASVRGVTRLVGRGVDVGLSQVASMTGAAATSAAREAARAVLNGVLGDHLAASGNPLAVPMSIRKRGERVAIDRASLTAAWPGAGDRLLIVVHGLCMNDLQWQHDGHDHATALASELGCTALHLHYNSGLHISANGRELASLLEQLADEWPVPLQTIDIIGHSMGGLLARSACHYAVDMQLRWPSLLRRMVFIGSPHHGAALERAGNRLDLLLGSSPYMAPFARLGRLRSAGVRDLRHGNLLDEDWLGKQEDLRHDTRTPVPLPEAVCCHAIAGSRSEGGARASGRLGDGLVSVDSALGRHPDPRLDLQHGLSGFRVFERHNHFDLLGSRVVFEQLVEWLDQPAQRSAVDGSIDQR